jgi:hypothetical protein
MTLLSLVNTVVMRRFGVVISHDVEDGQRAPAIHPLRLWTGRHVPGTWRLVRWRAHARRERPVGAMTAPAEIACEMMIDGPNVERPRSCGALPTVGTNGLYRYCDHHMAIQAGAGATTLKFDDGSPLIARRCSCGWRGLGRDGGPCPKCTSPQCACSRCRPVATP